MRGHCVQMHYEPYRKNFFVESPDIKALTEAEVLALRQVSLRFVGECECDQVPAWLAVAGN